MFEDDGDRRYDVVRNEEEQYALWPSGRELPTGWQRVGEPSGSKAECLALIDGLWHDLRPKSVGERIGR